MAVAMQHISPVAHLPVVLGVVRQLTVAALIETFCPPPPAHVLSCGRGVEALLLAILDGHHALSKVGARLEDRGRFPMLQPGLHRTALHDDRLGHILDALCAAPRNRVCGALALNALEVYALSTPWRHQDTTTITLYGAYDEAARPVEGPLPPRPASGHSQDGHDDRKQVLLSLGVRSEGLPLRMGVRAGNTRDSTETPVAIADCVALGLDGVALWPPGRPTVNAPSACAWRRGWGSSRWCHAPVRWGRRWRRGASSTGRGPDGSQNLVGPGRSRRDAGMGTVS